MPRSQNPNLQSLPKVPDGWQPLAHTFQDFGIKARPEASWLHEAVGAVYVAGRLYVDPDRLPHARILSPHYVEQVAGIPARDIILALDRGEIPFDSIGGGSKKKYGHRKVSLVDVEAWAEKATSPPDSDPPPAQSLVEVLATPLSPPPMPPMEPDYDEVARQIQEAYPRGIGTSDHEALVKFTRWLHKSLDQA